MKILHTVGIPQLGGIEQFSFLLSTSDTLSHINHNIIFLLNDNSARNKNNDITRSYIICNIKFYNLPIEPRYRHFRPNRLWRLFSTVYRYISILRLAYYLNKQRIDIMHIHLPLFVNEQLIAAELANVSVVFTIHSSLIFKEKEKERIIKWETHRKRRFRLVADSDETRSYTIPFIESPVPIIATGIDVEKFQRHDINRDLIREKLGISKDEILIGSVGRLYPVKGQDILIRAANECLTCKNNLRFIIVGEGSSFIKYDSLIKSFGISEKVHLYGFYEKLEEFLNALDIFVQPSRSEGFPLSVIEAMASGVPVISTDVGGISQLLNNGEYGIVIQSEDVMNLTKNILDLAENREKRKIFSQLSFQRAKEFSIDLIGKSYLKLYEQVLKQ